MDMEYYTRRLQCSREEKMLCMPLVQRLIHYAETARAKGLLSLSLSLDTEPNLLLREGLRMAVDSREPQQVRNVMLAYLVAGDYRGVAFLEHVLAIEGVEMIRRGESPFVLADALAGWFGAPFADQYRQELKDFRKEAETKAQRENESRKRHRPESVYPPFDQLCASLALPGFERLVRELDDSTLATAIKGASGEMEERLLEAVSPQRKLQLLSIMDSMDKVSVLMVERAQRTVLKTVDRLSDIGELVL